MRTNNSAGKKERVYAFAKRADGTVRQRLVQEYRAGQMTVLERGYFLPGTTPEMTIDSAQMKYHWADSFTDSELVAPVPNGLGLDPLSIPLLRKQAEEANRKKIFVHRRTLQ